MNSKDEDFAEILKGKQLLPFLNSPMNREVGGGCASRASFVNYPSFSTPYITTGEKKENRKNIYQEFVLL